MPMKISRYKTSKTLSFATNSQRNLIIYTELLWWIQKLLLSPRVFVNIHLFSQEYIIANCVKSVQYTLAKVSKTNDDLACENNHDIK